MSLDLVYPLYLDVPMMTSFYAALENGIAYDSDVTQKQDKQKGAAGKGQAGFGLPSFLSMLNMQGEVSSSNSETASEEVKIIRKHTEASLFIRLRDVLNQQKRITKLNSLVDFQTLEYASLVEITGRVSRNPLVEITNGIYEIADMLNIDLTSGLDIPQQSVGKKGGSSTSRPANQPISKYDPSKVNNDEVVKKMIASLKRDLSDAKVTEVLVQSSTIENLNALIPLYSDFTLERTFGYVLSGDFTVLGKVTRVLRQGEKLSVYQRTAINLMGTEAAELVLSSLMAFPGMKPSNLYIDFPAIEMIPLAIFI